MRVVYICIGLLVCLSFVCSRAPVEPEPDPCDECTEPCDPVPCDVVPCDIVEVDVIYEVFYPEDISPNNIILEKNDEVIFGIITERFDGIREVRTEFRGTYKPGDSLKGSATGSASYIRFSFHANE